MCRVHVYAHVCRDQRLTSCVFLNHYQSYLLKHDVSLHLVWLDWLMSTCLWDGTHHQIWLKNPAQPTTKQPHNPVGSEGPNSDPLAFPDHTLSLSCLPTSPQSILVFLEICFLCYEMSVCVFLFILLHLLLLWKPLSTWNLFFIKRYILFHNCIIYSLLNSENSILWDTAVGKGAYCQVWQPEFSSANSLDSRELTVESCCFPTSTCVLWYRLPPNK